MRGHRKVKTLCKKQSRKDAMYFYINRLVDERNNLNNKTEFRQ